jgi:hypothetical protein
VKFSKKVVDILMEDLEIKIKVGILPKDVKNV